MDTSSVLWTRLARFIANERIVVPLIWKCFLEQVLTPFRGQQLYFVLDNTPFRDDLTIVYLGLLAHECHRQCRLANTPIPICFQGNTAPFHDPANAFLHAFQLSLKMCWFVDKTPGWGRRLFWGSLHEYLEDFVARFTGGGPPGPSARLS